ncbi:MAG TPA: thiamine-phosphate kinase [Ktedonobacterales bacterium]
MKRIPFDSLSGGERAEAIGEFGLIARLTHGLESRPDVVLGVGDDAALLDVGSDMLLVATCDTQVEGRHFLANIATPQEIGHKTLAVNASDIAAMGAEPLWALISLLLPADISLDKLDGIYDGLRSLGERLGVAIVGGNVSGTNGPLTLDMTLLGRVARDHACRRSGGQPGDLLIVTGALGAAAAGLLAYTTERDAMPHESISQEVLERARIALVAPMPRVAEGRALAATGVVSAMLDVSDGLTADLSHICAASGVGAVIDAEALPIDMAASTIAAAYGRDPLDLALSGGEEYELLFSVPSTGLDIALVAVRSVGGSASVIGALTEARDGMQVRLRNGSLRPITPRGWDHLR